MDTTRNALRPALHVLAAAPHRLLFFVGATNVLAAVAWWALWLFDRRWPGLDLPQPAVYAGWMHAVVMQYQVLPPFIFGFLITVFPRWLNRPPLPLAAYVPVAFGLLGGQLLTLLALAGAEDLLVPGLGLTLCGWTVGLAVLLHVFSAAGALDRHALSMIAALTLGAVGLVLALAYAAGADARLMYGAIKLGGFGLLLPVYFTVCHRMLPFFASCVIPGYAMWRPTGALVAAWVLMLAHLALELVHGQALLWIPDLALAGLTLGLLWRWWPRGAAMPALLRVLFLGFAWLPLAFALYGAQSALFAASGNFAFGRAPTHALFIGYFGSLLVAMVTRVTQGHSGRPLELGRTAAFAFAGVQCAAVVRIAADVLPDAPAWQFAAAALWLLAFLPWALRSGAIYLAPRIDGKPG